MNSRLIVDEQSQLQEFRTPPVAQSPAVSLFARFISYIFHPVFIPLYVVAFMVYIHPWLFAGWTGFQKIRTFLMAILMYTFFPLVTVALLKGLNFIQSIQLRTQKDRVIPFIAIMIFYFWIWYVWNNLAKVKDAVEMPPETVKFALAAFISTILGLMMNIRMKVSLHAIAAGLMLTFFLLMAFSHGLNFGFYISVAMLITGLICTSRFIASDHTAGEVYGGLAVGAASMLIAQWVG